jgi:hypothetical protein
VESGQRWSVEGENGLPSAKTPEAVVFLHFVPVKRSWCPPTVHLAGCGDTVDMVGVASADRLRGNEGRLTGF